MGLIKKLKLRRWEKWGLTLLILFILGCIGLKLFIDYGIGDPKLTVKANDIKRLARVRGGRRIRAGADGVEDGGPRRGAVIEGVAGHGLYPTKDPGGRKAKTAHFSR